MTDCIFCKIIKGDIPSYKIFENDEFITILDINPNVKGTSLVISKEHHPSNPTEIPDDVFQNAFTTAKIVSNQLCKALEVERVGIAIDGTGIDHFHIKLYPFYKGKVDLEEAHERVYFESYPGYLTTQLGPQADFNELEKLANKINL